MLAQVHSPEVLTAEDLDRYLQKGWFRMGQTIFTTNFLNFKNQFYSAIWLRVALQDAEIDKTQRKLLRQNAGFQVEIKKAVVTPEKEALFARYKTGVSFEASASVQHLLYGKGSTNIYNTLEINIYDSDKLIAAGFFDVGQISAEGISSFYDPDYKKYSLGKYLIYCKLEYCRQMKLEYFYPGYFVPGYSYFDYKLELNKNNLDYLQLSSGQWLPISHFSAADTPLQIMHEKLLVLQERLTALALPGDVLKYDFFDAGLIPDLKDIVVFDFPVFLFCFGNADNVLLVVYDVRDGQYHYLHCKTIWASNSGGNTPDHFTSHILKVITAIFTTPHADDMATMLSRQMKTHVEILLARSEQ